jgi:uncharacterized membrane protein YjfL (UPF0719 family)
MDAMEYIWALYGLGYVAVGLLLLYLAKELFDLVTPYSVKVQLTEKDNPAVGVVLLGYMLGVVAVLCGVFSGEEAAEPSLQSFIWDLRPIVLYSALGMVLLLVAGVINDKLILRRFSNTHEIIENQNTSVAIIMATSYIGSGLIIAGGIQGSLDLVSALAAFGLGQLFLVFFAFAYQWATSYNDQEELHEKKNLAVGIAFASNLLAYSVLLMQGATMQTEQLENWDHRLMYFVYYAVAGGVLLPLLRIVNDRIFLPGVNLANEIVEDQNLNAGFMEAGLALGMGLILVVSL